MNLKIIYSINYIKTTSVEYFIIQYVHQKYLCEDFRLLLIVIDRLLSRFLRILLITPLRLPNYNYPMPNVS